MIGMIYGLITGRSSKWPKARDAHLQSHPRCVCCGQEAETVHHVKPVAIAPTLELEPENFASVCEQCHFTHGHGCNWRKWNTNFWHVARLTLQGLRGPKPE